MLRFGFGKNIVLPYLSLLLYVDIKNNWFCNLKLQPEMYLKKQIPVILLPAFCVMSY